MSAWSDHAAASLADDTVLAVRNVSKKFCRNLRRSMAYGIGDLGRSLLGLRLDSRVLRPHEFWALRNIDFTLRRGEVMGLVGRNGSGKSTLLRLLTGIFPPDEGEIAIKGRVGALIALGAGFHPHMSGRENIYLNGSILGMRKKEIDAQFDEIVQFGEVGDIIDAPVSTYSSGLRVRLGFAIAIHVRPDILLVDEVLSVGDYKFQRKCIDRMRSLIRSGVAVVFVSHNLPAVGGICRTGMLLEQGQVRKQGPIDDVIHEFLLSQSPQEVLTARQATAPRSGEAVFRGVTMAGSDGKERDEFNTGEGARIRVRFRVESLIERAIFGYAIYNDEDLVCCGNRTAYDGIFLRVPPGENFYEFVINTLDLHTGRYRLGVVLFDEGLVLPYEYAPGACLFTVRSPWLEADRTSPVVLPRTTWGRQVNDSLAGLRKPT